MRLTSIINVWSDCVELLPFCIKNHLQFCDGIIVVWSQHSNHGEKNDAILEYILANGHDERVKFHQLEPLKTLKLLSNEIRKRNHGIEIAYNEGFTHYLIADADEMYDPESMNFDKRMFDGNLNGLVHRLRVYVGKPTLWCDDHTLVPGIHVLNKNSQVGGYRGYPFAYDAKGNCHIDPSRRPYIMDGIKVSPTFCEHYSYVRKNIDLKIDNSSANLKNSRQIIYQELRDAKPGYVSKLYHQPLKESENYFNIVI